MIIIIIITEKQIAQKTGGNQVEKAGKTEHIRDRCGNDDGAAIDRVYIRQFGFRFSERGQRRQSCRYECDIAKRADGN
jgi:hypothetical protein